MNFHDLDSWDPMAEDYNNANHASNSFFNMQGSNAKPSTRLYVKNIPLSYDRQSLLSIFSQYGKVENVIIKPPLSSEYTKTFGFIEYSDLSDATNAVTHLQDNPQRLKVDYAKPQKSRSNNYQSGIPSTYHEQISVSDASSHYSDQTENIDSPAMSCVGRVPHANITVQVGNKDRGRRVTCEQPKREIQSRIAANDSRISSILPECFEDSDMPHLMPISDLCTRCSNEGAFSCSRCLMPYCSPACQRTDWPRHKDICKPKEQQTREKAQSRSSRSKSLPRSKGQKELSENFKEPSETRYQHTVDAPSNRENNTAGSNNTVPEYRNAEISNTRNTENSKKQFFKSRLNHPRTRINLQGNAENATNSSSAEKSPELPRRSRVNSKQDKLEQTSKLDADMVKNDSPMVQVSVKMSSLGTVNLTGEDMVKVQYVIDPDKFWVCREDDTAKLVEITKELQSMVKKNVESPIIGEVYCAAYGDGMLYRCFIQEIFPNETYSVHYIDYGDSADVKRSELFHLSSKLTGYPAMAIECSLANVKPIDRIKGWRQEDKELFSHLVLDKPLKAYAVDGIPGSLDLIDAEGMSVASVLVNSENAQKAMKELPINSCAEQRPKQIEKQDSVFTDIPLAYNFLQEGETIKLKVVNKESFAQRLWAWIIIDNVIQEYNKMECTLQAAKTDVTMKTEEGDLAVALSQLYEGWFRCYVIKRNKNSFLVRYVDYGGEEEVTKLCFLSEEQKKCCSPIVCFSSKPFSSDVIAKLEKDYFEASVKSLNNNFVMLSILIDKEKFDLKGWPWYSDISEAGDRSPKAAKLLENKIISPAVPTKTLQDDILKKRDISQKCLRERNLALKSRTKVFVVWCVSSEEIYIRRTSDTEEFAKFQLEIYEWCVSVPQNKSLPSEGDVVFAKFSKNNTWYRCQILDALPKNTFEVFFLDCGNKGRVESCDIRPMNEKFTCPRFTICVSLCDIPISLSNELKSLINKELELEVVHSQFVPKKVVLYENGKLVFSSKTTSSEVKLMDASKKVDMSVSSKGIETLASKRSKLKNTDYKNFQGAQAKIVHMDESKHFYVQLESLQNEIVKLQKNIYSYFHNKTRPNSYSPTVDDLIGAYSEGSWYRGYVTDIKSRKCRVKLFDFGYLDEIDESDIHPLPAEFLQPAYSIPIVMDKVPDSELVQEVADALLGKTIKLEFTDIACEPPKARMYIDGMCLNDQVHPADVTSSSNHVKAPEVSKMHPEPMYAQLLEPIKLSVGTVLDVTFVYFDEEISYMQKLCDLEHVSSLSAHLEDHCKTADPIKRHLFDKEMVCTKSAEDGKWYRAMVKEISNSKDKVKVFFVDFGNCEVVKKENIYPLPPSCMSHPKYSVPVLIRNRSLQKPKLYLPFHVKVEKIEEQFVIVYLHPQSSDSLHSQDVQSESNVLSSHLKTEALVENSKIDAMFVHTEGTVHYLQRLDQLKLIGLLSSLLQNHCNKEVLTNLSCGKIVCAKSAADSLYYRAVIEKIEDSEKVTVLYIDYGNTETIRKVDVHSLPTEAETFPVFCYPSVVLNEQDTPVPSVPLDKPYSVLVCKSGDKLLVRICEPEKKTQTKKVNLNSGETNNNECQAILNGYGEPTQNVNSSGKICTAPENEIYCMLDVQYVAVETGKNNIIIYNAKSIEEIFWAPFVEENITKNASLLNELTKYYSDAAILPYEPRNVGQEIVAAKYVDGDWYRAAVLGETPNGYRVVFLDYGDDMVVSKESIKKIIKQFLQLPLQAHYGALTGFAFDEVNREAINTEVSNFMTWGWRDDVVISTDDNGWVINSPKVTQQLIKKGLARRLV